MRMGDQGSVEFMPGAAFLSAIIACASDNRIGFCVPKSLNCVRTQSRFPLLPRHALALLTLSGSKLSKLPSRRCLGRVAQKEGPIAMKIKFALASVAFPLLMVAPAMSQTRAQEQAACQDDALRLCSAQIPDETAIRNCLARQRVSLSPACRAQFKSAPRRRRRAH